MSKYLVRIFITGDMHFQADMSREQAEALIVYANGLLQNRSVQKPKVHKHRQGEKRQPKQHAGEGNLRFFLAVLLVAIFFLLMFAGVFS